MVTPTQKTLSVSGEHDLLEEVERLQRIEQAEREQVGTARFIKVPHPYFYHRSSKVQCYGMEEIDGINLQQGTEGEYDPELGKQLREVFGNISFEDIAQEVEHFFDAMHSVCLHGDVKPANLMVSKEGIFYVIDFGQSVHANTIYDKNQAAFENLKDEEKKNAKNAIRFFLDALRKNDN